MARTVPHLGVFYYLDHFHEMLVFLEEHHSPMLGDGEMTFIHSFRALPKEAQALYVRLQNRRGKVFEKKALKYVEIPDLPRTLTLLFRSNFIEEPRSEHLAEILTSLTKPRLIEFLDCCGIELTGRRSWAKGLLLQLALENCQWTVLEAADCFDDFLIQGQLMTVAYLQFLYFGRLQGLQSFTLRDLGLVRTRTHRQKFQARFRTGEEAEAAFFHARLKEQIRNSPASALLSLLPEITHWPEPGKDQSVARLGRKLERAALPLDALQAYSHSELHPARERRFRLLYQNGEKRKAQKLLADILADPSSDEELLAAEDFLRLKFSKETRTRLTDTLRSSAVIQLDEAFKNNVERAAAHHFTQNGKPTFRSENHFWNTLFGTVFWEELQGETQNQFDVRPTQLVDGTFFQRNREAISRKLEKLTPTVVSTVFKKHFGEDNGVFRWRRVDEEVLTNFLTHAPQKAVSAMLERIAKDPAANRTGFPDLVQITEQGVRFIEVKAEGDVIRRHQLVQIEALKNCGFAVDIVRVRWGLDPDQEYVVVDIETTGGRATHHRITEIGAVKVRSGKVIDTWQTLLNPERSIPSQITRITGISQDMVSGAPKFADLADDFRSFIGEAIFVAHNANFDYGFIRQEFNRLDQVFRRPTLCTVSAMRKYFPGHRSYSLGRLCTDLQISLEDHHRALCDARATAELLLLINQERLRLQGKGECKSDLSPAQSAPPEK